MFALTFYLLPILCWTLSISEGIASTTQKPSEKQEIKELKSRLESLESRDGQSTTNEIQYRLELLELKNKQVNDNIKSFVKILEAMLESRNEQSKVIYEKIDKIQHTLEIESNNKQCATEETHHKLDIFDKFDTLDSKIEEIAQKLGTMNQILSQSTNYNLTILPKNCREVQQRGHNVTKIYEIQPDFSPKPIEVLCDMERRGGGWTYFLNRFDGSQDFDLTWEDYKIGFGKPSGEFWLGLENIHYLTGFKTNELLVELMDWDNKVVYAHYDAFSVGSESEGYSLKILGKYEGTAGNSFRENSRMKFTTKDKDQDIWTDVNCARLDKEGGGWWYRDCGSSYLTGKYYEETMLKSISSNGGINWKSFHGYDYSLKQVKMMIKPQNN